MRNGAKNEPVSLPFGSINCLHTLQYTLVRKFFHALTILYNAQWRICAAKVRAL